jgi:hypothetical protein
MEPLARHSTEGISNSVIPHFGPRPAFTNTIGFSHVPKASQRNGLRFQSVVEKACLTRDKDFDRFTHRFSEVMCGPWIYYVDAHGVTRYSQPDVLLFDHVSKKLLIIECKLNHTRYAWGQYKHYQALLRLMYPAYSISGIETCKNVDPMESYAIMLDSIRPHTFDFACYLWID